MSRGCFSVGSVLQLCGLILAIGQGPCFLASPLPWGHLPLPPVCCLQGPHKPNSPPAAAGSSSNFLSIPFWMLWLTSPHQSVLSPRSSPVPLTAGAAGSTAERQSVAEHPSGGFPEPSDTPEKNDTASSRLLARICFCLLKWIESYWVGAGSC